MTITKFLCSIFFALLFFSSLGQTTTPTTAMTENFREPDWLPSFRFYTLNDSTLFTSEMLDTAKPTLFFYFSTQCPYCEAMMKEIFENPEKLKNINVVLVSGHKRSSIKQFLSPYDSVRIKTSASKFSILKDDEHLMRKQFVYAGVPMIRTYNKNQKLLFQYEGRMNLENVLKTFL